VTKLFLQSSAKSPYLCSMKQLWAIPLLLLVLSQVAFLPAVTVWLSYNQAYIASELCENRFEPELMCSGRCYVQEVTSAAIGQEQDSEQAPVVEDQRTGLSPFLPAHYVLSVERDLYTFNPLPPATALRPQLLSSGVFHPPRA
jgi:hypothetical protein